MIKPAAITETHGFTLIELLLVLVIVATVVAVASPDFSSGGQTTELKRAVRDIASALRFLRGQALITRKETYLTIDLEQNQYRVSGKNKSFSIDEDVDITLVTAQSELQGEGRGRIRFFADGSSTGGRVTLEIGDRKQVINVNWLTGLIEINEK